MLGISTAISKKLKKVKNVYRLICFFAAVAIFLSGCERQKNLLTMRGIREAEAIEKVSIFWTNANEMDMEVKIDFLNKKKTILALGDGKEKVSENWNTEKFESFFREEVIPEVNQHREENVKGEQRILWRIVIQGRENRITQNGFKEYPKYWEKLLKYIL